MDVTTLKAKIKSKQLPSYLIFSGDEWKVQQIYINQISKATGKEIRTIDSVADIYDQLRNRSFIQKGLIYKVRDDKELMQNEIAAYEAKQADKEAKAQARAEKAKKDKERRAKEKEAKENA